MTNISVRRLADKLAGLERQVIALATTPQLAASSIEDGAVTAFDRDGQLTMIVGQQPDGTTASTVVAGPPPAAPAGLSATGGQLTVTASWDGSWTGGGVAPLDLARVEVHVTAAAVVLPDPLPGSQTRVGTIETAAGSALTFSAGQGEAWVWLLARSQAGKVSDPAGPVKVIVTGAVDPGMFEQASTDLAGARARLDAWAAELADVQGNVTAASVAARAGSFLKIDAEQLTVTGTSNLADVVAQRFFTNIFAANNITANEINAASVGGVVGEFVRINAEQITGGVITASIGMWAGGSITAGQWNGSCAVMDGSGFKTRQVAEDGTQYTASSLGNPSGVDQFAIYAAPNSPPVMTITEEGVISAKDLTTDEDPAFAGRPLLGKIVDDGSTELGWLEDVAWGVQGRGNFRSLVGSKSVANNAFQSLGVMSVTILPGRSYRITMPFAYYAAVSGVTQGQAALAMFYTLGTPTTPEPADPTTSSSRLTQSSKQFQVSTSDYPVTDTVIANFAPSVSAPVTMKILVNTYAGSGITMAYSVSDGAAWVAWIEDIGTAAPDTARLSTAPAVNKYVSTWTASDSRGYLGDGTQSTFDASKKILRHGYYQSATGNSRSAVVFNTNATSGETTKTMSAALSGATLTKAEIWVQSLHWYASTGGNARFFPMTGSSLPATLPTVSGTPVTKRFTARSQGFWITVPTSWFSASNRGFAIGPAGDNSVNNYGYFASHQYPTTAYRPRVRLSYTR